MLEQNTSHWIRQAGDLAELVHWIQNTPRLWRIEGSRTNGNGFSGASMDEALRMAREGWDEGVGRVSALVDSLPTKAHATRTYGLAGEFPDVPRCVSGDPFNMVRRGMAHRPRPVMTIAMGCCTSGATPAKAMENYAAAMVAIVDKLENQGVSVELIGNATSRLATGRCSVVWGIKREGEVLDLSAVAFGAGHPAMLRRLCFAAWERSAARNSSSSYGQVADPTAQDFIGLPDDTLIIPGVGVGTGSQCMTLEGAVQFAEQQINAASVALTGEAIAELEVAV